MPRILLIDDDEQVRLALAGLLRVDRHEVVTAADGAEGLEWFQRQAFDLVITDLIMPKKGGPETIAALRRLRPGLKIIAMYGGGRITGADSPATAQSLGADRLLAKPITLAELRAAVSDVLKVPPDNPDRS
jgi:CheY-like chemotaxis protein